MISQTVLSLALSPPFRSALVSFPKHRTAHALKGGQIAENPRKLGIRYRAFPAIAMVAIAPATANYNRWASGEWGNESWGLPQFQGHGYATEMVGTLVDWALSQPNVRTVVAEPMSDNVASVCVVEKLGSSLIGTAREGPA